jgi:hypothetical protein
MFHQVRRALGRDLQATFAAFPIRCGHYLHFMDVVGRPRDWAFRANITGRFRMRPGQGFMPFEAWHYNTRFPVERLFHMRLIAPEGTG